MMEFFMNSNKIIIIGAGGHSKVLSESLNSEGLDILGYVVTNFKKKVKFCEKEIMGNDNLILSYEAKNINLVNGVGSIPFNKSRYEISIKYRNLGYSFRSVIHKNSSVSKEVFLEEGAQLMRGVILQAGVSIGKDTIVNTGAILDHDCIVSENCHIAPGVICSGGVVIGRNTHIGTGAKIIQGIKIGSNSIVAAGSVVYKDIPSGVIFKQKKINNIEKLQN